MGFEKTLKREVGIAAIYMFCLAKHVHRRFTDHLDQGMPLTCFGREVSQSNANQH